MDNRRICVRLERTGCILGASHRTMSFSCLVTASREEKRSYLTPSLRVLHVWQVDLCLTFILRFQALHATLYPSPRSQD